MTEPATIRVLIVDEYDGARLGLTTALALIDDLRLIPCRTAPMPPLERSR